MFFFYNLDSLVKIELFKVYCSSFYGCELWHLSNSAIEEFCIAWCKAVRRVFGLLLNAHSCFLPLLTDSLPIFDEICKMSARFVYSCLLHQSPLVKFVSTYAVYYARHLSSLGSNL